MVGPVDLNQRPHAYQACDSNQLSYALFTRDAHATSIKGFGRRFFHLKMVESITVRTDDPLLAKQVLFQLSYDPIKIACFRILYI